MLSALRTRGALGLGASLRARARSSMSYSERMDKTGRPVSPHVFIYNFPAIAISSITVRITGVALTVGTTGIACSSLLGSSDSPAVIAQGLASSAVAPVAKFLVAFPLTYHYLAAVRHTYWDKTAKGFTNAAMLHSSYALFGASTVISLALAAYSISTPPTSKKE